MHRFEFADEVRQTLARERFGHPDPRVQRRMEILWLKPHGETHQRIASWRACRDEPYNACPTCTWLASWSPCGRFTNISIKGPL